MGNETVDYNSLTPAQQQEFDALDRGRTQANLAALPGQVLRDPYGPIPHTPGEGLRSGMGIAQQNIANLPMQAARAMGAQPGGMGEMAGAAGSGLLNFATAPFGTPEGTAVAGALGPMRAVGNALPRFGNLAQTSGLGAIGGAAAGLTGGDVGKGTGEGLAAGVIGGLFKKVTDTFAQKKEDVLNFAKGIVKDVPWLEALSPKGPGAAEIAPLLAIRGATGNGGIVGQQLLSQRYGQAKAQWIAAIGKDTPIDIPALDSAGATNIAKNFSSASGGKMSAFDAQAMYEAAQKAGMFGKQTMTIERALDEANKMSALANNATDGALGWTARERSRQIQKQIAGVMEQYGGPALLADYKATMEQYGKGKAILSLLENADVFKLNPKGGTVDFTKLQKYIADNIDQYGPLRFPALNSAATRNAPLGSGDVTGSLRIPRLYGHGVSEGLGAIKFPQRAGELGAPQMGNPTSGLGAAYGGVALPEWVLQNPPGSQTPLGQ